MNEVRNEVRLGSCHCGAVVFEVTLSNGLEDLRRCNCSLCSRRGALIASVPREQLRVVQGEEQLRLYQWNTKIAEHYFCADCGIYTHHRRRSKPDEFGFNIACLEGVDTFALERNNNITLGNGAAMSLIDDDPRST